MHLCGTVISIVVNWWVVCLKFFVVVVIVVFVALRLLLVPSAVCLFIVFTSPPEQAEISCDNTFICIYLFFNLCSCLFAFLSVLVCILLFALLIWALICKSFKITNIFCETYGAGRSTNDLKKRWKSTLNTAHLRGQELTDSCFSNNKKHSHKLRERKLSILEMKN